MRKISLLILIIIGTLTSGVYAQKRESRSVKDFKAIKVSGGINLYVSQESTFSVEVETEGDIEDVQTYVEDDLLILKMKRNSWNSWKDKVNVYVSLPQLEAIKATGGTDVESRGTLSGEKFVLHASGGSDIELDVDYAVIDVNCSGGSDTRLAGTTGQLYIEAGGGSDFEGFGLKSKEANVRSSGASDINVWASEKIDARASGASDITYRGNPEWVNVDSSGGSDITRG